MSFAFAYIDGLFTLIDKEVNQFSLKFSGGKGLMFIRLIALVFSMI